MSNIEYVIGLFIMSCLIAIFMTFFSYMLDRILSVSFARPKGYYIMQHQKFTLAYSVSFISNTKLLGTLLIYIACGLFIDFLYKYVFGEKSSR